MGYSKAITKFADKTRRMGDYINRGRYGVVYAKYNAEDDHVYFFDGDECTGKSRLSKKALKNFFVEHFGDTQNLSVRGSNGFSMREQNMAGLSIPLTPVQLASHGMSQWYDGALCFVGRSKVPCVATLDTDNEWFLTDLSHADSPQLRVFVNPDSSVHSVTQHVEVSDGTETIVEFVDDDRHDGRINEVVEYNKTRNTPLGHGDIDNGEVWTMAEMLDFINEQRQSEDPHSVKFMVEYHLREYCGFDEGQKRVVDYAINFLVRHAEEEMARKFHKAVVDRMQLENIRMDD